MKSFESDTGYDAIKLENRREIEVMGAILREWLKSHPRNEKADFAKKAAGILEGMWYNW